MDINLDDSILQKYDQYLQTELKDHHNVGPLNGFSQYNLLAHLSTYFNDKVIIDIGTGHEAVSARALAYNKTNKVISYDTEFCETAKEHIDRLDNVEYKNINPLKDSTAQALMLSSPFISLDVDPHDGVQELEFYDFFIKNNWKGIMVCDDIGIGYDSTDLPNITMAAFWDKVNKPKYDLTKTAYSHNTGTGLIAFGDQEINNSFVISASDLKYREKHFNENPANWAAMEYKEINRYDDGTFETNDNITGTWEFITINKNGKTVEPKTDKEIFLSDGEFKRAFTIKNWAGTVVMPVDG
tara:strand:+ start:1226 stop:2119 length:894 start_codon:yes stop_codon:yes gene_type:complete